MLAVDGRERTEPVDRYMRLRNATTEQRQNFEYDNMGIHWPELDEDMSFDGFFDSSSDNKDESDICRLFKAFPEINVSGLAQRMGIKQSLMAGYICGIKKPSESRRRGIVNELHAIGKKLMTVE